MLLSFILMLSGYTRLDAQPCLPDGISFTKQSQIDSFQYNHPNCTEIGGSVTIYSENITNLNGLSVLTSIGWGLSIHGTSLVDLSGLDNLSTIGGSLSIGQTAYGDSNRYLVSLSGLNSLTSIGGVFNLKNNIVLSDISALSNLRTIGATLHIENNDSLKTLSGFNNLEHIGNHLIINGNNALQSLVGLDVLSSISVSLNIWNNESLVDFSGLDSLEYVGGMIGILSNRALTNVSSLSSLDTLGHGIHIQGNNQLADITGFINIDSFSGGGDIRISMNQALMSLSGLDSIKAESITGLIIDDNGFLSECAIKSICDYLADPNGEITIYSNDTGCDTQAEVEEACFVGISEQQSDPPLSTHPNPFITSTTIEYELKEISNIQFTIYNVIGEVVYMGEDRMMPQGKHSFTWTAERLPEGMYYAVLRSEEGVEVVKMVKQ